MVLSSSTESLNWWDLSIAFRSVLWWCYRLRWVFWTIETNLSLFSQWADVVAVFIGFSGLLRATYRCSVNAGMLLSSSVESMDWWDQPIAVQSVRWWCIFDGISGLVRLTYRCSVRWCIVFDGISWLVRLTYRCSVSAVMVFLSSTECLDWWD